MDKQTDKSLVDAMFEVGAQYGYSRSKRHPTSSAYVFGAKNGVELVDLEKSEKLLAKAEEYVEKLAAEGKTIMLVGTKQEAKKAIEDAAAKLDMPYVTLRWIGGTLTNFSEIKKRLLRLEDLKERKATGALLVYTKRERMLLDKEIADLEKTFSGIEFVRALPHAVLVIDSKHEKTAVAEAKQMKLPVIALQGTDCSTDGIAYPIVANDAARASITFFVERLTAAFERGRSAKGSVPAIEEK